MESPRSFGFAQARSGDVAHDPEVVHHEDRENGPHPIETESLRRLVTDDVGNPRGHAGEGWGRAGEGARFVHGAGFRVV